MHPGDGRPHPREWVRRHSGAAAGPDDAAALAVYLRHGMLESFEFGYSHCRFQCGAPEVQLGCCSLTDGTYVWPEGLAHYVEAHGVRLPGEVEAAMLRGGRGGGGRRGGSEAPPCLNHLQWDAELRRGVPLPADTAAFLSQKSTLKVGMAERPGAAAAAAAAAAARAGTGAGANAPAPAHGDRRRGCCGEGPTASCIPRASLVVAAAAVAAVAITVALLQRFGVVPRVAS